jgi:hypothetical protein
VGVQPFLMDSVGSPVNAQAAGMHNTYIKPVEFLQALQPTNRPNFLKWSETAESVRDRVMPVCLCEAFSEERTRWRYLTTQAGFGACRSSC